MFLTVKRSRLDCEVSQNKPSGAIRNSESFSKGLSFPACSTEPAAKTNNNEALRQWKEQTLVEETQFLYSSDQTAAADRCTQSKHAAEGSNTTLSRLNFNTHSLFAFRVSSISSLILLPARRYHELF